MNGYRKLSRKQITLPSGATCVIRKMKAADWFAAGDVPLSVQEARRTGKRPEVGKLTPEDLAWMARLGTRILTHCVGPITLEGETTRIVDKPWTECADDETAISEVEQSDADAIVTAVQEFSSMGKEAGEQPRTFPKQSEDDANRPPARADVREAAVGDPGPRPG